MRPPLLRTGVAILGILVAPTGALALGLDVLEGGASLDSGNGLLTFSDFEVVRTGSIAADLSLFDVEALAEGLAISGPIVATAGDAGDLFIRFTVTSSQPLTRAELEFEGEASGTGSSASVTETFERPANAQLFVYATGGGARRSGDSLALRGATTLRVSKDILVDSAESGDARIERIEQRFTSGDAPEPQALLLLGAALLGLRARRAQGRPSAGPQT